MRAYYNEFDPFAAAWLRELIRDGHIAAGDVDERSITDVEPADFVGYTQCHFFAGIGGWSLALRLAGWPDDRPVWTGSCPCQPFSAAGKQEGADDPRHLWPAFYRLIRECRPDRLFGEQVASAIGHGWLDLVSADLEREGYAVGAAVLGAHSVGAPHRRQRLWFVADRDPARCGEGWAGEAGDGRGPTRLEPSGLRAARELADGTSGGRGILGDAAQPGRGGHVDGGVQSRGLGDAEQPGLEGLAGHGRDGDKPGRERADQGGPASPASAWADALWLPCRDGKARPTQPGLFPLAHGVPNRVGTLRGAGNAIVPQVAAEFVRAYMDATTTAPAAAVGRATGEGE